MRTQMQICSSTKLALDLNNRSGNLFEANRINTDWSLPLCLWKNSACSVGSQRHCAAGLMDVDACKSSTDSGADRVNTPAVWLSVPLASHRCCTALVKPATIYYPTAKSPSILTPPHATLLLCWSYLLLVTVNVTQISWLRITLNFYFQCRGVCVQPFQISTKRFHIYECDQIDLWYQNHPFAISKNHQTRVLN